MTLNSAVRSSIVSLSVWLNFVNVLVIRIILLNCNLKYRSFMCRDMGLVVSCGICVELCAVYVLRTCERFFINCKMHNKKNCSLLGAD